LVRAGIRVLAACAVLTVAFAAEARAEWQFAPFLGLTFNGDTSLANLEFGAEKVHWNFGGAVTAIGEWPIGVEGLFTYTPQFFEGGDDLPNIYESSSALALMGNVVLAVPRSWNEYGLRPFVSGGIGLMSVSVTDVSGALTFRENLLGFNVGGGAVGFLNERTGLRFDLRYYSNLKPSDESGVSIGRVRLSYWTGSVGVVIRY
jgi:hypothetical protein